MMVDEQPYYLNIHGTCALEIHRLEAENTELKRQLAEREWQPIETAPRSTWQKRVELLVWNEDARCCAFGEVVGTGNGQFIAMAHGYQGDWRITHWMPLPPAPKQKEE